MATGLIYLLSNKSIPGLLKIGYTMLYIEERLSQLNTTGVPEPFEIAAAFSVNMPDQCEKEIHDALREFRVSSEREFFRLSLQKAIEIVIPIVQQRLFHTTESEAVMAGNDVTNEEGIVLDVLGNDQLERMDSMLLAQQCGYTRMQTEVCLGNLKTRGYVREFRDSRYDSGWTLTPRGSEYVLHLRKELEKM